MGTLADAITLPISGQPISASAFGVPVKDAIDSIEDRVDAIVETVRKRKSADQLAASAATTYVNCDTLFYTQTANSIWMVEYNLIHSANTTQDLKFAITYPAGSTVDLEMLWRTNEASLVDLQFVAVQGYVTSALPPSGGIPGRSTATDLIPTRINLTIATAGTAGTVQLQFAHVTAGSGASGTLRRGSHMRAERIS